VTAAPHFFEGVLEVDLKETQRGVLVLIEGVTERMCYDLYSSFATHSIVLACEGLTNFRLACDAETLADEATNGVPTCKRANRRCRFLKSNRNSSSNEGNQELRG
jgi:hypothetical protein